MKRVVPLLIFSILLLVPVGVQESYAGFDCTLEPAVVDIILNSAETSTPIPKIIDCMGQVFASVTTDISDCSNKGIDVSFANEDGINGAEWTVDETITNTGGTTGEEICNIIFNVNGGQALLTQQIRVTTSESLVIGGTLLTIDSTALILAGAQTFSWMIPVVMSVAGIGLFVVSRKS